MQLKIDSSWNNLPPVLTPQQYIDYTQYALENSIKDTDPYAPPFYEKYTNVFGIYRLTTNCPTFITCSGTNIRPNRVPLSTVYFTPRPQPLNILQRRKQEKQAEQLLATCNCPYINPIRKPVILSIIPGNTIATLLFAVSTSTDGNPITNYEYSIDGGITYLLCIPAVVASPITITGLTNGITYTILLKAMTKAGTSDASNFGKVTPSVSI
jgi:hypothetical protein